MQIRDVERATKLLGEYVAINDEINMIRANSAVSLVIRTMKAGVPYQLAYDERNTSPNYLNDAPRLWEIIYGALIDHLIAKKTKIELELSRLGVDYV